jgi:hypothetical protein
MTALRGPAGSLFVAVLAAGLLTGCATFKSSKRADLGPFSENTMQMAGELQKFNRPPVWTHLKRYQTLPSVLAVQQSVGKVRILMRGVALYSSHIAALADSPLPMDRKVSEMARYMDENIRPQLGSEMMSDAHVTPGYMDTLVANMRHSANFLDALRAAQPLVNLTSAEGDLLFDQIDVGIRAATADINAGIDAEFGDLRNRVEELDALHVAGLRSYTLLENYRGGNAAALDSLRRADPALQGLLPPGKAPAAKDLDAAERYVIDRATTTRALRDQLEPQFALYKENQSELDALRAMADERARLGRAVLFLWARSHRNLSAGISVPPMIDVIGIMKTTASTGVKGVLP